MNIINENVRQLLKNVCHSPTYGERYQLKGMKVSVIIPVYNVAPYVEHCLKSVMSQTYSGEMECPIVDDGSTDESEAIIQRQLSDYSGPIRLRLIHHDHNRGLSAARNTGIREATGDYIFFLDSDDEITADCLETLVDLACKSPDAQMVVSDYRTIPETKRTGIKLDVGLPLEITNNDDIAHAYLRHWLAIYHFLEQTDYEIFHIGQQLILQRRYRL